MLPEAEGGMGAFVAVKVVAIRIEEAGLVAAGLYPNPVPIADVTTSTTHKTLGGPRGGIILARANADIEKKLNSMGITAYEQVANWTRADIDRISQVLDFKGRIERENWIEQARILASGGQTEFSRRVDRGDA